LRVLEDGTFRMVGGTELVHVNVRVIAATNKKLETAVAAGTFREDLFYRLQVIPIRLPPLRERPEDIPLLVENFLAHFAAKHQRRRKQLSAEAMQLCQRFPWPGNVRQLRNVIERVVLTSRGATVSVADLPEFLRRHDQSATTFSVRPGMTLAEVEKLLIRQTLTHVTRNRDAAAKTLGISRRTLQYKLKQYGLLDPPLDTAETGSENTGGTPPGTSGAAQAGGRADR
jgi:transcriptional regulator with PAS, ATPase and Fis domain